MACRTPLSLLFVFNLILITLCAGKKCPTHEQYSLCTQSLCRHQNCSEKGTSVKCARVRPEFCIKGCVCKRGYLRAKNNTCIPEDQCPLTCGKNEVVDNCPVECASDYCPKSECESGSSCAIPDPCPPPKCKCALNHRRAENGTCIPTRNCPSFDCSEPNEKFDPCPPMCPSDDCSQASPTGECPKMFGRIGILLICEPECRCIKGYWRKDGVCVPYGECPGVCPTNERYSYCLQGECRALNCTQKGQPIPCPRIDPKYCKTGCVCQEGYLRDKNGKCVPEDKCKTPLTCGENQESRCVKECPPETTCRSRNVAVSCLADGKPCEEKCVCKQGFYRNAVGDCITNEQCDQCKGDHEYFACSVACDNECSKLYKQSKDNCPIVNVKCNPKCYCEDGYARNANGTCIAVKDCPGVCPAKERYSDCIQAECQALKCTQKDKPIACPMIAAGSCETGCVCQDGYLRADDGTCIPEDQCKPPLTCGENQESRCVKECPPEKTCRSRNVAVSCLADGKPCEEKCVCKQGFYRNAVGDCITNEQCDQCKGDHEYFACSGACDNECSELYKQSKDNCPIVNFKCNPKCYCEDGYARNANGTCVAIKDCPKNITCGEGEVVDTCPVDCPSDYCPTSDEQAKTRRCPKPDVCPPATCKCGFNSRRDENGKCIPTRDCPPLDCSGGPNQEYNSCPPYCPGEQCGQATADGKCHTFGRIGIVLECFPTCRCIKSYARRDGVCVPFDECKNCPGPHEVYTDEKVGCPPNTCMSLVAKYKCQENQSAISGCVCDTGYLRKDVNEPCIRISECPQMRNSSDCIAST